MNKPFISITVGKLFSLLRTGFLTFWFITYVTISPWTAFIFSESCLTLEGGGGGCHPGMLQRIWDESASLLSATFKDTVQQDGSGWKWSYFIGRGGGDFQQISPPPTILRDPFKDLELLLVFWLAIWKTIEMADKKICCAFVNGRTVSEMIVRIYQHATQREKD